MAKQGRPPKARAQRGKEGGTERAGTVSHRPLPAPVVVGKRELPTSAPADLPELAREVWDFIVAELAQAGIVASVDLPQLRAFCIQVAREQTAGSFLSEPFDETEAAELDDEIREMEVVAASLKSKLAGLLRAGVTPETKDLNAARNYSIALTNLRAYRTAKKKVGNMVALGSMGQLTEHPLIGTERAAAALMLRFATEFALTPTARARLGIAMLEGETLARSLDDDLGPSAKK